MTALASKEVAATAASLLSFSCGFSRSAMKPCSDVSATLQLSLLVFAFAYDSAGCVDFKCYLVFVLPLAAYAIARQVVSCFGNPEQRPLVAPSSKFTCGDPSGWLKAKSLSLELEKPSIFFGHRARVS